MFYAEPVAAASDAPGDSSDIKHALDSGAAGAACCVKNRILRFYTVYTDLPPNDALLIMEDVIMEDVFTSLSKY
jgi:hypothetical protein